MTDPSWVFRTIWHPRAKWYARWRALWLIVVRRHETEICSICGGRVRLVWHVDDDLWLEAMGEVGGVACPNCFDRFAGESGPFLYWMAERHTEARR